MNIKLITAVCLVGILLGIRANAATAPAQWYNQVTIGYVYAGQAGNRVAIGVNAAINFGSCPGSELVLDQNSPYFKSMLAMIMTVYSTEKTISVFTDGTCTTTGVLLADVRLP